ncbi:MAG: CRISPR-associated endonuclease Cas3'', partial [Herpetosiphon sp.]|nr:CRISPR-associated endonuclease Cas3'' [Herpetosiphon sp.]
MNQRIFELWGKTTNDERYHPAVYHMLDVAYASQVLISNGGSARVRSVLEDTWQGANIEALVAWIPFLVALHDIGKISAPFQGQASNANAKRQLDRLIAQGFVFPTIKPTKARLPHSSISALFIRDHLGKLESGIASDFKRIMV